MRIPHSLSLLCASTLVRTIDLDVSSTDSILSASKTIVENILQLYNESDIPGLFPRPYYFWQGGLAFNALINYYTASGGQDEELLKTIQDGMLWQVGPDENFMPPNQSKSLGNDDQGTWALAAMTAAEQGFPTRSDQTVTWLQLAQNVFDSQVLRWDDSSCGGGLRWQIFTFNNGYSYKNSVTQGSFVELAARLARFTGNSTYSDWAQKATQWTMDIGLISSKNYAVYDGTSTSFNCSDVNTLQGTMSAGLFISSGAYSLNSTTSSFWSALTSPLIASSIRFFTKSDDNILYEVACAASNTCNTDQLAFKATLARALANARDLLPTADSKIQQGIITVLQASAQGAAAQCSGGDDGTTCGSDWTTSEWDGTQGLGQDLNALEIMLANIPARQLNSAISSSATTGANVTSTQQTDNGTATQPASPTDTNSGSGLASYSAFVSAMIVGVAACLTIL